MDKPIKKLFYTYTIVIDSEARKLAYKLHYSKRYYYGISYEDFVMYSIDKNCYEFEFDSNDVNQFENVNMSGRIYFLPSTKKLTKEGLIEKFKEHTKQWIEIKTKQLQETCDMVVNMLNNLEEK